MVAVSRLSCSSRLSNWQRSIGRRDPHDATERRATNLMPPERRAKRSAGSIWRSPAGAVIARRSVSYCARVNVL